MEDRVRKTIRRLIAESGKDMKYVSREVLGRNHAYIQQFLDRHVPEKLKEDDRRALAKFFNISETELGGTSEVIEFPSSFRSVNVYDVRVSAGGGSLVGDEHIKGRWPFNAEYLNNELGLENTRLAIVEVRGDSMEPTLSSGDRVMVNLSDRHVAQPGIFVLYDGDGTVIKRVEKIPGKPVLVLISDNPLHGKYEVAANDVEIAGRVVWAARRL